MYSEGGNQVLWAPQEGPQTALIHCPLPLVGYGGARGGGKTDGALGKFLLKERSYGSKFNAVFFRKEMPQQDDIIERARELYEPLGARYNGKDHVFNFGVRRKSAREGGRIRFRPLENVKDAAKYQGQNVTDAVVEEAGDYADPDPIWRLFGCLRSKHGVPIQLGMNFNPGGPGHQWLKETFIDPAPFGMQVLERKLPNGNAFRYVFIPSSVWDNKILLENDPTYIDRLYLVGSEQLVEAWLYGRWDAIAGAFFDKWAEWAKYGILRPFTIPQHWTRIRSYDHGYASPFSVGWWAISDGTYRYRDDTRDFYIPAGAAVRYREWYGKKAMNKGLRIEVPEIAKGILERSEGEKYAFSVADPSIFANDGGPSIAKRFWESGVNFKAADNDRPSGWSEMRMRFRGRDRYPDVYCFATCTDSIRTIPSLQHDDKNAEDLNTKMEDHAADDWRYFHKSRPIITEAPKKDEEPVNPLSVSLAQLRKEHAKRKRRS